MPAHVEIDDDYDHNGNVEYILENVLMPDDGSPEYSRLKDDYNSQLTLSCTCTDNCSNIVLCCHGDGIKYTRAKGELVLLSSADKQFPSIIECNDLCECPITLCTNRRVQYGPRKNLEVFESPLYKSKGLRTTADIPCGAFICEYAGELLTLSEAQRRLEHIDKNCLVNYILCLNEHVSPQSHYLVQKQLLLTIVDPAQRGNIGRYLNHSCQPNCEILPVRTNCPIPKVGIFAKHDIYANEELCFHYAGEEHREGMSNGKPCLCGAPYCIGVIPNTRI
ncbi:probable histone-lysine N-methyltransferase set-23 isoform X1 [Drosophila novamexicana]|uniref:probable histone-lysine N-methyltransferase set-23 isoform X1 n=1 Tax=Drosophila novamexicana TaxID=47314 RepID=UPI0011E5F818|nr:probable histone-lysine N-methyltransferase set-23 isoform X1 [Drosophila novamexicana]